MQVLTEDEVRRVAGGSLAGLRALEADRRAVRGPQGFWVAAERLALVRAAYEQGAEKPEALREVVRFRTSAPAIGLPSWPMRWA